MKDLFLCFLFADWYRGYLVKHKMLQVRSILFLFGTILGVCAWPCQSPGQLLPTVAPLQADSTPVSLCPQFSLLYLDPFPLHSFFKADFQSSLLPASVPNMPAIYDFSSPIESCVFYLKFILYCLSLAGLGHSSFPYLFPTWLWRDRSSSALRGFLCPSPIPHCHLHGRCMCFAHLTAHGTSHSYLVSPVYTLAKLMKKCPSNCSISLVN